MTSDDTSVESTKSIFSISNQTYDLLKTVTLLSLPGLSTLYFILGTIFNFPAVEETIGTLAALCLVLGIFLRVSTNKYNSSDDKYDGSIVIGLTSTGNKLYSLELHGDPNELDRKDSATFKIGSNA